MHDLSNNKRVKKRRETEKVMEEGTMNGRKKEIRNKKHGIGYYEAQV
jgi:hypothetical protein